MEDEVGLGELITQFIDYKQESVNTAIPAIVLGVKDGGRGLLLDVQPSISIKNRDGSIVSQTAILNVPMQQPASSIAGTVFPVAVGDTVLLVFSQRGIDTWKYGSGAPTTPTDFRKFDRKDCIAIPCIFPTSKSIANETKHSGDYSVGDTILFHGSTEVICKADGNVVVNSPNKVTVNCTDAEVNASESMTVNTQTYKVNCTSYTVSSTSYSVGTTNYSMNATGSAVSTGTYNMNGSFILNGIAMESHGHIEQGDGNRVSNPVA